MCSKGEEMVRQDYFQRKAHELLEIAQATRDPRAASVLRRLAESYAHLAGKEARDPRIATS